VALNAFVRVGARSRQKASRRCRDRHSVGLIRSLRQRAPAARGAR
jgi:hypothetical protein